MKRFTILLAASAVFILFATQLQASTESKDDGKSDDLKIVVTSLEITDKALNMTYEIINHSKYDIWMPAGGYIRSDPTFGMNAGSHVSEDGDTLVIWVRFDRPPVKHPIVCGPGPVFARFVRLPAGQSQTESIFMEIPVYPLPRLESVGEQGQGLQYAKHLAVELGFFLGDVPERIYRMLEEREKNSPVEPRSSIDIQFFSATNECLISREDAFLIMHEDGNSNERSLRTVIESVHIPYQEISNRHFEYERPDLKSYTKIEIKYRPSMLDYFFPFDFQKSLLSSGEMEYLQSERTIVIKVKFRTFSKCKYRQSGL
jgi:hypothetical protein